MVMADKGEVSINGQLITKGIAYKKMIGYMPQIGRYPQNMTIGQIIEMVQSIRNTSENLDLSLYQSFGMDALLDKKMGTLSGGTTQKVSAVLAFMFNPPILILDEPTAGLDPISAEILKEKIIAERNNGKLIIITSHLLSELDNMVSEIIFMQEGKVAFHQSVDKLKTSTGTTNISEAILRILKSKTNESNTSSSGS